MKIVSNVNLPSSWKVNNLPKSFELTVAGNRSELLTEVETAEVLLLANLDAEILKRAKNCKLIQAISGGIDKFMIPELVNSNIPLTCLKGCFNVAAAEHALAMLLLYSRGLHRDLKSMPDKKMGPYKADLQFEIKNKTLGVMGLGEIGAELVKKAQALGMKVIGLDIIEPDPQKIALADYYDIKFFEEFLKICDFVSVCLPLTEKTRKLIGGKELRKMKKTACLIDVSGRDDIYDYPALEKVLLNNEIAAACMQPEKEISGDCRLWDCENFIYSYHRATSIEQSEKAFKMICDNLSRLPKQSGPVTGTAP